VAWIATFNPARQDAETAIVMNESERSHREAAKHQPVGAEARWTLALFVVATVMAAAFVLVRAPATYGSLYEAPRIAAHIAQGHGFASPIDAASDAELTTWLPPVYPYLIATAYSVFGVEAPAALNSLLLLNALCFGLLVSGVFVVGRDAFGRNAGLFAALGVMFHPLFVLRTAFYWDTYPALAGFIWLVVAAIRSDRSGGTALQLAGIGAGLGVLALTNVSYLAASPVLVLLALRNHGWGVRVSRSAIALGAFTLVLVPWTLRNYDATGELLLIRGGPSFELWLGNRQGASGWMDVTHHPLIDPVEREHFKEVGEKAYWVLSEEKFAELYAADPMAFWARTARRVGFVFVGPISSDAIRLVQLGPFTSAARIASDFLLVALAVGGLVVAWRAQSLAPWLLGAGVATVLPFVVSHVTYRYTMPLKLVLLLLAGVAVARLFDRLMNARSRGKHAG
jgi:4-amino-4-deoxy-L-arabinose transferase-like glycosyltransferase